MFIAVAGLGLGLISDRQAGQASENWTPSFDILGLDPVGLGANGAITLLTTFPADPPPQHLPVTETLEVPAGWDIAADADIPNSPPAPNPEVVGFGIIALEDRCEGIIVGHGFNIVEVAANSGFKARWEAIVTPSLSFSFDISGDAVSGHTIFIILFLDGCPAFGPPLTLTLFLFGRSSQNNLPVLTNPTVEERFYTWTATFESTPLPSQHSATVSDQVPVGNDADGDTYPDFVDNCPATPNAGQNDYDGDAIPGQQPGPTDTWGGDACDSDVDGDGVLNTSDQCLFTPLTQPVDANGCSQIQVDQDLDGLCDPGRVSTLCTGADPCPSIPDCDLDGWTDLAELVFIGTDPLDACPDNLAHDALPVDFNNDASVTGADLSVVAAAIGQTVPPALPRKDIAPALPDGAITGADLSAVAARIGRTCV